MLKTEIAVKPIAPTGHPAVGTSDDVPQAMAEGTIKVALTMAAKAIGMERKPRYAGGCYTTFHPALGWCSSETEDEAVWSKVFSGPTQADASRRALEWAMQKANELVDLYHARQASLQRWRDACTQMGVPFDLLPPAHD